MQQHTKIALQSRRYSITGEPLPCDICFAPYTSVHHLENSYRAKRNNDKYNLSCLCETCHSEQHKGNQTEKREELRVKVKWILDNIEERKIICRKFNYYL